MDIRFWVSVVVIFVLSMALGFVVHGALLGQAYANLPDLFRAESDAQDYFGFMLLAHVFLAAGFVWIYRKGHEPERTFLLQGIRFGIVITIFAVIPTYLIYYAVQPMPLDLVSRQIIYDSISVIIMGVVVAALNKDFEDLKN